MCTSILLPSQIDLLGILLILLGSISSTQSLVNITVDNADSRIEYHGNWKVEGNRYAVNGSVSATETPGDFFALEFTGIAVYVLADCSEGAAPFTPAVDGIVLAKAITGGCSERAIVPFWGIDKLSTGRNHMLNITLERGANTATNFDLDALIYTIEDGETSSNTTVQARTSPTPSLVSFPSVATYQHSSASDSSGSTTLQSSSTPSSRSMERLPVVGGVVGGFVFCLLSTMGACHWFRRIKQMKTRATPHPFVLEETSPEVAEEFTNVTHLASLGEAILPEKLLQKMDRMLESIEQLRRAGYVDYDPPEYDDLSSRNL